MRVSALFLSAILAHLRVWRLLSNDHFSVDGTLIEAWASMKSFRPRGDSQAWLADTIARIADHPARRVAEMLPWNYRPA